MPQSRVRRQRSLFDGPPAVPAVRLPLDMQAQLRDALVQWLRAVAKAVAKERGDDQDHR
jgi:hypothetical protein